MYERLKRYETLLQEKGIDLNGVAGASTSTDPESQTTVFKPKLLHGQAGTKLVDK